MWKFQITQKFADSCLLFSAGRWARICKFLGYLIFPNQSYKKWCLDFMHTFLNEVDLSQKLLDNFGWSMIKYVRIYLCTNRMIKIVFSKKFLHFENPLFQISLNIIHTQMKRQVAGDYIMCCSCL